MALSLSDINCIIKLSGLCVVNMVGAAIVLDMLDMLDMLDIAYYLNIAATTFKWASEYHTSKSTP